ncbi:amidohydrolase family protein [uncultured Tateyamaria sp.]|uniref:amidohydrolase family protein n=1 Tax=uncultured Tateyamaria sp. TaxID=455651 RepID=UPI00263204DD|nr:amidohydrolase family protein [uncultured Tateyamaria sp.]
MDVLAPLSLVAAPARFGGTVQGDCLRGQPVIRNGALVALDPPTGGDAQVILPRLIEPHCHLDKCHTITRLGQVGGDLHHAIASQYADKVHWDAQDIETRARQGLAEAQVNGCAHIRSHVDWGDTAAPPLAWSVLTELAQDHPGLQLAALIGIEQWADPGFADAVGATLARTGGVAGAFVHGHDGAPDGVRAMFDTANRHGLMLDFHVDEGLGDLSGLEMIADIALATGCDRPILCGHCVSLMDRGPDAVERIADKLVQARIAVCALPVTNLYLQGRGTGTPDRRGITRMRELRAAGVPVIVGSDNVADAFCPIGAHDPRAALGLACLTAHLDPPLGDWLPAITTDAARAIGVAPTPLDGAAIKDVMICDAAHTADLISGRAPLRPATETLT